MNIMTTWKTLSLGVLLAPLSTFPVTILCGLLYWPFMDGRAIGFGGLMFVATVGTVVFSYPATIVFGLSLYKIFKKRIIGKNPWLYVVASVCLTAAIANTELLDKKGLFGFIYLSSAASCSWLFWFLAIRWPDRVDTALLKDANNTLHN